MANVYATKTGNWSDTTVWNTGALPTSSDDVYANTFTVTIDQDITVLSIRNSTATSITAGGGFACSTARTLTLSGAGVVQNNTNTVCLTLSHTAGTTVTIVGAVTAATSNNSGSAISSSTDGTTTITGAITGGGTLTVGSAHGIMLTGAHTLNVTGNVTGGQGNNTYGIYATAACTITIVGNLAGQNGANGPDGLRTNAATGTFTVTVTGNVTGASNSTNAGSGLWFNGNATVNCSVTGTITASGRVAIQISNPTNLTVAGSFISSATGRPPITGDGLIKLAPVATTEYRFLKSTGGTTSLYSADYGGQASPADVRYGILYGTGNALTGTLRVPPANSVASGVPVDNTTGTAALLLNDVAAVVAAQIAATLNS